MLSATAVSKNLQVDRWQFSTKLVLSTKENSLHFLRSDTVEHIVWTWWNLDLNGLLCLFCVFLKLDSLLIYLNFLHWMSCWTLHSFQYNQSDDISRYALMLILHCRISICSVMHFFSSRKISFICLSEKHLFNSWIYVRTLYSFGQQHRAQLNRYKVVGLMEGYN